MPNRLPFLIALLLILAALAFFIFFAGLKEAALAFHEVDFPFYMQFSARLFDPALSAGYTINPEGGNFLGFTGVEGADHFHQSLHFEPFKYLFALLYRSFPMPQAVFAFIGVLYVLPALYLFRIHPKQGVQVWFPLLFTLLYLGYPAAAHTVTFDLRPRVLLVPTLLLAVLSIHYRRPVWERILCFGLLFLVREEALLLGLLLIVYELLHDGPPKPRVWTTSLFLVAWLVGLAAIYAYFRWTGYQIDARTSPLAPLAASPGLWFGGGLLFTILVVVWLRLWVPLRQRIPRPGLAQLVWYGLICLSICWPLLQPLARGGASSGEIAAWLRLNLSQQALYYSAALLFLVLLYNNLAAPGAQRKFLAALTVIAGLCLLYSAATLPGFVRAYNNQTGPAQLVTDLRAQTDRQTTYILSDYATIQAFYDYERVFAYQRLPWRLVKGKPRYYPQNQAAVERLLREKIDYIAVSRTSQDEIQALLDSAGLKPTERLENEGYVVMRLR